MAVEVDGTAYEVYKAYQQEIALAGGTYDRGPQADVRVWNKCANLLDETGLNPSKFMQAQFAAVPVRARRTLRPNNLFRSRKQVMANYAKKWAVVTEDNEDQVTLSLISYLGAMESSLSRLSQQLVPSRFSSVEDLLMESTIPFDAWFRILAAPTLTRELIDRYLEEARLQVMQDITLRATLESRSVSTRYDTGRLLV